MGYKNAEHILPQALLKAVQRYAEGECLYIPRIAPRPRRQNPDTALRNADIRARHAAGCSVRMLAEEFYLSPQAIYKILSDTDK